MKTDTVVLFNINNAVGYLLPLFYGGGKNIEFITPRITYQIAHIFDLYYGEQLSTAKFKSRYFLQTKEGCVLWDSLPDVINDINAKLKKSNQSLSRVGGYNGEVFYIGGDGHITEKYALINEIGSARNKPCSNKKECEFIDNVNHCIKKHKIGLLVGVDNYLSIEIANESINRKGGVAHSDELGRFALVHCVDGINKYEMFHDENGAILHINEHYPNINGIREMAANNTIER